MLTRLQDKKDAYPEIWDNTSLILMKQDNIQIYAVNTLSSGAAVLRLLDTKGRLVANCSL